MPRPRHPLESRPPRITHVYGTALRWTKVPGRTLLTPETAMQLRAEGYTMALTRSGWRSARPISLIRYVQRIQPSSELP
ncbi:MULTISPECIES: hypothetical protein [Microbacterium]|jgi:hypothetical protein|uniref:hypothetical protein n=1 Tax=Microbacterium TaxID=33882 RepID=UPI0007348EB0|nr:MULTISPECIES: hypothetical protein [Microbacterium]MDF2045752.1 hypothetical protein [Microbacterium sp. Kw_RZR3]MDQ1076621.1 hypothetical protein [Microbacterium sp. SORGH_AS_0969]MDQ1116857.1 hypothetical protein [Microbacterium testaceum]